MKILGRINKEKIIGIIRSFVDFIYLVTEKKQRLMTENGQYIIIGSNEKKVVVKIKGDNKLIGKIK
ncbi:MAG: hypothetical protein WC451_04975 [Patescibacteria group bacterium]